jgi:hypothetical protein
MKKIELIVTIHGESIPDGKDRKMVVVGELFVDPGLKPEFDLKPGGSISVAFKCYKIDEEKSSKDKTSFIEHTWRPSTGDMVIMPRKSSYKTTVKVNKIA